MRNNWTNWRFTADAGESPSSQYSYPHTFVVRTWPHEHPTQEKSYSDSLFLFDWCNRSRVLAAVLIYIFLWANSDAMLLLMAASVNLETFAGPTCRDPSGFPYLYNFRCRKLELTWSTWRQHQSSHVLPQCLLSPWALSFFPFSFLPYKYLSSPIREWGNLNTHAHAHTRGGCH